MKPLIVLILMFATFISCSLGGANTANKNQSAGNVSKAQVSSTGISKLFNSEVCMVNNKFMGKEQIAVPLNNETYYGCCPGCVKTLKEDAASRFGTDPFSGEQVDKAIAFITIKPGTKEDVLYFQSEANAKKYFEKQTKH